MSNITSVPNFAFVEITSDSQQPDPNGKDSPPDFRTRACLHFDWKKEDFEKKLYRKVVFRRAQVVIPLLRIVNANFFFAERKLVQQIGFCLNVEEVQNEIDFYMHKYVTNSFFKEALGFRLSGRRTIYLAEDIFDE